MRITPKPTTADWRFKQPVKAIFARKFYDHDGSLGGGVVTLTLVDLPWLEGVLDAGTLDPRYRADLEAIAMALRAGDTVDMWFET
jgi:hypothetical protein